MKVGDILTGEQLKKATTETSYLNTDRTLNAGVLKINKKYYLIKRIGKCEYKKCKALCCKFICNGASWGFVGNFGKKTKLDNMIIKIKCNNILKNNKCKLFNTDKFPKPCQHFPHPTDAHYQEIADKCFFKFKIIGIVKDFNKGEKEEKPKEEVKK